MSTTELSKYQSPIKIFFQNFFPKENVRVSIPAPWKASEGDSHIKWRQGYLSYLLEVTKAELVPQGVQLQ